MPVAAQVSLSSSSSYYSLPGEFKFAPVHLRPIVRSTQPVRYPNLMKFSPFLLLIPAMAALNLSSCVDPMMPGGIYSNGGYGGGFRTYSTLPRNYSGSAYYHQGRYYSGGQYQTGSYYYQGRPYSNRYYHNGQYYYGGQHQNHSQPSMPPSGYRPSNSYPSSFRPSNSHPSINPPSGYRPSSGYPSSSFPSNNHPSGGHSSGSHSSGGHSSGGRSEHHEGWNRSSGRR